MKCIVQRVKDATVTVDGEITGAIDNGLLVYLGITHDDTVKDIDFLVNKIPNLRVFVDDRGKMNLSAMDLGYKLLVVSQFTIMASCKKGRRPSYDLAAKPDYALKMYNIFLDKLRDCGIGVETGRFREHMEVNYTNSGPITVIVDSKE